MTEFEKNCYGLTEADIRAEYLNGFTARACGPEMVVMSILSDAQHVLEFNDKDRARKFMNIAKFILSEMMEAKREKEAA